ncbi:MAG: response regulator, partial [Deltaproteobacteria bacterium]|nr:response regulator [Deltaproteobacteria bacterium]
VQDITERKRSEEVQKKLEAQLQQAQKMEAIGTLAGGVAHDFNNLLMGIQGRVSLISLDLDSRHPHFDHLKGIEEIIRMGASLTRQLLGFARGGKYVVQPTNVNKLIFTSSQMFGRTKKEIRINRNLQEDIWTVEVDQAQIEQALLNLYVNAWHAMPGGGDLYLKTENVIIDKGYSTPFKVETGKYVKMTVTDTGVGMDQETQRRIFEPFFTTREMGGGTGLGLASVYGIVKNHGGIINVYSEKGKGTTFTIYLPASQKDLAEEKEETIEIKRGKETILLVDDEEMILTAGKEMLKSLGYKVFLAESGQKAVEVYSTYKEKIDMVILDMIMPGMGGREVYDRLKEIDPNVKVLLSSGYSLNGLATEMLERGCTGFIQKPFGMKQISLTLRKVLDKKDTG